MENYQNSGITTGMEPTPRGAYNVSLILESTSWFPWGEEGLVGGPLSVLMAVLYLAVCVLGLAGNGLVMAAILKLDRMSTATTVYIFNLALADGLFMVGLPFVSFQYLQDRWPFGDLACRLLVLLDGINQFTSVFCLTVMSVDRCLAAADPVRFGPWRRPSRAKVISLLLWPLSLLPVLPMALRFSAEGGQCGPDPHEAVGSWWMVFITCAFVLGFALPFSIMALSYAVLALALKARGAPGPGGQPPESQATRMVASVAVVFAICWLPFYAVNFYVLHHSDTGQAFDGIFRAAVLLSYAWSCTNPVLYACFSDTFRRHFCTLLCRDGRPSTCDANTEAFDLCDDARTGQPSPV
ncbi:somatostatin receptor type 5 [Paramormyrops kingsleyae]|uniref:somatostatin receptor type 5 n=1 Tax=Paramormyrops kingsleyae TaxID=1676925 RepID=UPI003B9771AD